LKDELAREKSAKAAAQADLEALKDQHQAAQQESAKATEEHLATKDALLKAQAEAAALKAAADTKQQTSKADYMDMHESLTQLVEEAEKKAADKEALVKELEANLKVKDAEIEELKVYLQPIMHMSHAHQCTP
jgi:hypothetical protein